MNTTTLQGVFPQPKPVCRRNFIKENVKQIKEMQGLMLQDKPNEHEVRNRNKCDKYQNTPNKTQSFTSDKSRFKLKASIIQNAKAQAFAIDKLGSAQPKEVTKLQSTRSRFTSRGIQTERVDDLNKLYETGIIKYPRQSMAISARKRRVLDHGDVSHMGDAMETLATDGWILLPITSSSDINEKPHDFVKANKNIKPKIIKTDTVNHNFPPPTYQKGVLPKYLRERKGYDKSGDSEPDCPPGHILLPEEERKETLRVLRQSYADRVQELNSLPVRSDTLKIRKRKMEIEEELKKIDEGIKVFQRPKVFVKVNA